MNKTRRDWSGLYKCCREKKDSLTAFYSLSAALFVIAIAFYGLAYWFGTKYPPTEPLDNSDITGERTDSIRQPLITPASSSVAPTTRQAERRAPKRPPPKKSLSVNKEDSDDEILIGANSTASQNLISLNN